MRRRRSSVLLVIVTLAAGALGACGGDDGDGDSGATDARTSESTEAAESSEATTAESTEATETETSEATDSVNPDSPIPFAVGNQWKYRIEYAEPIGTTIYTQEVKAIEPTADGDKATLRVDYHFLNKNQPDFGFDIFYTVHPDGALSVPFTAFGIADVNFVNSGSKGELVWPSLPGIRSGDRKQGEFSATITGGAAGEVDADYRYDIKGAGDDPKTVEAGEFPDAVRMDLTFDITIQTAAGGPIEQTVTTKIWFAEGVGLLQHEAQGGISSGTVTELVSTNVSP
jgi:hypothetical protein